MIAVEALDECNKTVTIIPAKTPKKILKNPFPVRFDKNPMLSGSTVGITLERKSSPRNNIPKPIKASPKLCFFNFLKKVMKNPIPKTGMAKAEILKLKPKSATIQAVIVVPMFAPKITPMDWGKVINPAFTKETTITVVAPED